MKSRSLFGFDFGILIATIALMTIGILFIYSSGITSTGVVFSNEYIKQIIFAAIGLVIMGLLLFIDYSRYIQISTYLYWVMIGALLSTLVFGRSINGAKAWFGFGIFGIQVSEFCKITTILFLAKTLTDLGPKIRELKSFLYVLGIILLPVGIILLQPDLGTAIVFFPIFMAMTFIAGAKLRHILFLGLVGLLTFFIGILPVWEVQIFKSDIPALSIISDPSLLAILLISLVLLLALSLVGLLIYKKGLFYWLSYVFAILVIVLIGSYGLRIVLKDYQIMRLIVFLDPSVDPKGAGWNIIQSITAVGSGGVSGKGFLQGTQSHYRFLPQQSTDFIFSILAEEWGFVGAISVFVLFLIICIRGLIISYVSKDNFASFASVGIVAMFFFHVIINIGMAIGIMPVTGIPLFFLSYGGSSLWTGLFSIGLLLNFFQRRYRY